MNQKQIPAIKGFFVAIGDERNTFPQGKSVNTTGRAGVFYKKKELVRTISSNPSLNKKDLHVIEVEASKEIVCPQPQNKFGIMGGKNFKVVSVQSFEKAEKEMRVSAN